ncbi:CaiB/BaiF CoA-transferase family protein [Bradyrhizobium sp. JYMT SZCCT0428]|uniref:CaiB/BaiF CoA transferase family protein n=1 Tax=Bradyrhizobium sp. JYMT SZCCT0428 TaxID=2807673 RepID=UPI001BADD0B6|nr:CoA transferase [Bradyrhizobium sp. JYMT SZCCT0428]MBR1149424.1 CoA transferase [Bradyrhizobium sp. JYMT SZCCT0428]
MISSSSSNSAQLPLAGIRVIEFCQIAAGPFCGMLLADFGADVVKIENPDGGDGLRSWPPHRDGYSENFASLNRNKRSVALDLKHPDDLLVAKHLCRTADVVVENNRPGVMDRLGLGYASVASDNPKVVYCSISGFGQDGPRSQEGGFDVTIQAIAGVMSVTGEPDGGPVKCGVPISDFSSGLYAAFSVAAALRLASQSGQGQHIDISLLGATLAIAALQTSEYFGTGRVPKRLGAAHPRNAPYEAFQAKDDWFVLAAGNNKLWTTVCSVVKMEELSRDPRFLTNSDRAKNQRELRAILEGVFGTRNAGEWVAQFQQLGVPCGLINSYAQALDDPQVIAMDWVQDIALPSGSRTKTFGCPVRINGVSPPIRLDPPALGAHNSEFLLEGGQLQRRAGS